MNIIYHAESKIFHLYNDKISYIIKILKNGQIGQLYYGKKIKDREDFSHFLTLQKRVLAPCEFYGDMHYSMEVIKQDYPAYGTGDYRECAYQMEVADGSRITDFKYKNHNIYFGKKDISNMPHSYANDDKEVMTLEINLYDSLIDCEMTLFYHIFDKYSLITRSSKFTNFSENNIKLLNVMSTCLDLPDYDYEMLQLDGAWARERHITTRKIDKGIQSISSSRGASGSMHNPFLALKRPNTTNSNGEVYAFTLIYSGNFLAQAEVDQYDVTRVMLGINPFEFEWKLEQNESFASPEAVMVYSDNGLNEMSQTFHNFFRNNLCRGYWKDKTRPILLNNWEATYFDFNEESILKIAKKAKEVGVELFVLDDGWFGKRDDDTTSLGDWYCDLQKLPNGIAGLSKKICDMGLKFGLWFEPEMINEISELYKNHSDWVIGVPNRNKSYGRNQFVLDFSRKDVVDYIFNSMDKVISESHISYIKWDMNRNITQAYSKNLPKDRQKEFFHRYILGVYDLYERLTSKYPKILFESCASGGGRFDAGMLYYAPQAWTSDDTDAVERLKIQYGTSMLYPIVSMGSHIAAVPNHQVNRSTSIKMRADVAYFGTFGYELDLNKLSEDEIQQVKWQIAFFKQYRELIQYGDFYRLTNDDTNEIAWLVVAKDKKKAILGCYQILSQPNKPLKKVYLLGLDENKEYKCKKTGKSYFGDELMNYGLSLETEIEKNDEGVYLANNIMGDFTSQIFIFE